jgi:hypothetical protein
MSKSQSTNNNTNLIPREQLKSENEKLAEQIFEVRGYSMHFMAPYQDENPNHRIAADTPPGWVRSRNISEWALIRRRSGDYLAIPKSLAIYVGRYPYNYGPEMNTRITKLTEGFEARPDTRNTENILSVTETLIKNDEFARSLIPSDYHGMILGDSRLAELYELAKSTGQFPQNTELFTDVKKDTLHSFSRHENIAGEPPNGSSLVYQEFIFDDKVDAATGLFESYQKAKMRKTIDRMLAQIQEMQKSSTNVANASQASKEYETLLREKQIAQQRYESEMNKLMQKINSKDGTAAAADVCGPGTPNCTTYFENEAGLIEGPATGDPSLDRFNIDHFLKTYKPKTETEDSEDNQKEG